MQNTNKLNKAQSMKLELGITIVFLSVIGILLDAAATTSALQERTVFSGLVASLFCYYVFKDNLGLRIDVELLGKSIAFGLITAAPIALHLIPLYQ